MGGPGSGPQKGGGGKKSVGINRGKNMKTVKFDKHPGGRTGRALINDRFKNMGKKKFTNAKYKGAMGLKFQNP